MKNDKTPKEKNTNIIIDKSPMGNTMNTTKLLNYFCPHWQLRVFISNILYWKECHEMGTVAFDGKYKFA